MGLKKENYVANGVFCEEAYAMFETADTRLQPVKAVFKIHNSRENADKLPPLERRTVIFHWDRNKDLVKEAYKHAKTRTVEIATPITGEPEIVEIKGVFDGWTDDVVTE